MAGILSLGVGRRQVVGIPENPQPNDRVTVLTKIAEDCEGVHQEVATRFKGNGVYHRLNVERGLAYIEDDEWVKFEVTRCATFEYFKGETRRLEAVVRNLVQGLGGPLLRDLSKF